MAAKMSLESNSTCDTPQLPNAGTSKNSETAKNESEDTIQQGEQGSSPSEVTILSLQRDLRALQSKISRLESRAKTELGVDSDTEDDFLEFSPQCEDGLDDDSANYPGDAIVNRIWDKWYHRRRVAKDIIRKSDRLRKLKKQGRLKKHHLNDPEFNDGIDVTKPRDFTKEASALVLVSRPCTWREFKLPSKLKEDTPVIEVLIEKPVVIWRRARQFLSLDDQLDEAIESTPAATAVSKAGEGLPDRIRVNSTMLLLLFASLHGADLDAMFPKSDSIVLLKPFKMLVYFQHELREQYSRLIAAHVGETVVNAQDLDHSKLEHEPEKSASGTRLNSELPAANESATAAPLEKADESTVKDSSADSKSVEKDALASRLMLEHMHPLMQFINDYIAPRQRYLDGDSCDKVTFHDMWLVFKPGVDVIASDSNQAYRVIRIGTRLHRAIPPWEGFQKQPATSAGQQDNEEPIEPFAEEGDNKPFKLWCVHIDSDGSNIGPVTTEIEIDSFKGEMSISNLPVQPLRLRQKNFSEQSRGTSDERTDQLSIQEQLIERGKYFIKMSGIEHAYYSGPTFGNRDIVEGQVVVDNSFVFKLDKSIEAPELSPWAQDSGASIPFEGPSSACNATCCANDTVMRDTLFDQRRNSEYLEVAFPRQENGVVSLAALARPIAVVRENHKGGEIKDPEYLIMSDRVYGFILQTRKWAALDLRFIRQVDYGLDETKTAFDDLVLPSGHRNVILSLVAQHFRDGNRGEVDIIRGKGKGLILLLHGAPGVGKTSTAEGIAEAFRRPLLQITSGDLGLTADKVGEYLQRNFDLASRWGCVLLLDEADVFLASRTSAESSGDLNRNALVAVFLRVLEYYTGILFLTTNRIGDFDEAFASRIHLSLEYPQLDKPSTQSILALNIGLIKKRFKESGRMLDIEEEDICAKFTDFWDKNKSSRLNGRQIRNACQTALALAEFEAQGSSHRAVLNPEATVRLQPSHFDTILKAYLDFAYYLNKTYGITPDERAKEQKLRAKEQSAGKARAKATHSHAESVGSHTGGFGGAHLYNQPPTQHLAPGQFVFQSSIPGGSGYVMPTQNQPFFPGHQGYQSQMPTHQGFPNMQFAGSNASMPDLSAQNVQHQANLNAQRQANFLNPQRIPNEMDDTHAGHSAHYQGQPANPGLPSHYPQPQ